MDIVDKTTRSRMMAGIHGKDTKPEMIIRRALHRRGFRYKLHDKNLPGKPDMVFPKYKAVIQVHGCFWHKHGCHLFKWPQSRPDFWKQKIRGNSQRDKLHLKQLEDLGWRVLIVWECSLRGRSKLPVSVCTEKIVFWLERGNCSSQLVGDS